MQSKFFYYPSANINSMPTSSRKKIWKKTSSVSRLTFSRISERDKRKIGKSDNLFFHNNKETVGIGSSNIGRIFVGRIQFKDGSKHRVAIKVFKNPITDKRAQQYQQAIDDLREAGVRLPKMAMVKTKIPGEQLEQWVQVSQLFGSSLKGSKIKNKTWFRIEDPKGRKEAIEELTKVANAGYFPADDLIEPFRDKSKGVMPIDLDMIARLGKAHPNSNSEKLIELVKLLAKDPEEYRRLISIAMKTASPKFRTVLSKRI